MVFDDEGRVLLLGRLGGTWVFPKGHIDPGEDALQTAIREIEEEAGLKVEIPEPELQFHTSYVNDRGEQREVTWFIAEARAQQFRAREELFPEGEFMPVAEALTRLSWPEDRQLLQEAARARSERT